MAVETVHVHHRVHVLNLQGKPGKQLQLPLLFSAPYRPDIIHRAVVSSQANRWQPYGSDPMAGLRRSVEWPGKGRGMARTPRVKNTNRGGQVPNTVGGRQAHPPRAEKERGKKINVKERRRAFVSALAATREVRYALERGHLVPEHAKLPLVLDDEIEGVSSTGRAKEILELVGIWPDVVRAGDGVHVRAGRGKGRGRTRRFPKSLLVVISKPGVALGFRNLTGVDVVPVDSLGTEHLAPGGVAGRLTLYSVASIQRLEERLGKHVGGGVPLETSAAPEGGSAA